MDMDRDPLTMSPSMAAGDVDVLSFFQFTSESPFTLVSRKIGAHEAALKLLFSLLIAYPIVVIYNVALVRRSQLIKHLYFTITGLCIGFFNYGINILHTTAAVTITYCVMRRFGGTKGSVAFVFSFCTIYLLWGYYMTQSDEYAFAWTIPQCVATLRLISVAFDAYDGRRIIAGRKRSEDGDPIVNKGDKQRMVTIDNNEALFKSPSFLELTGHTYFPASFLVGPQFGMKRYQTYVSNNNSLLSQSIKYSMGRLVMGILYMIVFQAGSLYFPLKYLNSDEFRLLSFLHKIFIMAITTKIQLCKYICIWLISEGSCIISGVTYDQESNSFYSCSNVNWKEFETTITFGGLIRSFNVTTNVWSGKYIFRRLKFLDSKFVSHLVTLLYLALWHGWRSGYYVTFTMEFMIMKVEWTVISYVKRKRQEYKGLDDVMGSWYMKWPLFIVFRSYVLVLFGYCLISFMLLSFNKWIDVLQQMYFFGHVLYIPMQFLLPPILSKL